MLIWGDNYVTYQQHRRHVGDIQVAQKSKPL